MNYMWGNGVDMENVPETVIEQLRAIRSAGEVQLGSRQQVRAEAQRRDFIELVEFLDREDDSRYHDALVQSAGSE